MHVTLNGKAMEIEGPVNVRALIGKLGAAEARTAVMINGDIAPRDQWSRALQEGDQVEVLVLSAGG